MTNSNLSFESAEVQHEEKTEFKFDELSTKAKEKAREWYRNCTNEFEWWEGVYDDAVNVAAKLGIDINNKSRNYRTGMGSYRPEIYFSGFWSQGDGASFAGDWDFQRKPQKTDPASVFRRNVLGTSEQYETFLEAIQSEFKDEELERIATVLDRCEGFTCSVIVSGKSSHSGAMSVELFDQKERIENAHDDSKEEVVSPEEIKALKEQVADVEDTITEAMRDFADWIYGQLKKEYEYMNSDEVVDDNIRINEYTFDEDGRRT